MYLGKEPQFTQFPSKFFNGDGTAMTVSLDYSPPNEAALLVFIDGVRQDTDAYNISGTSLTFTGTVASGTNNVQVVHMGLAMDVGVPGDDTISTVKIADDAVTAAKLANSINTEIAANTAKVTNATHTGDVTGATALTIAVDAVDIPMLSATGTASATTYLRGDNAWSTIATGTSWQSVQTTGFTAVAGNGYPCNTTSGSFTVTLPASASVGDTIELVDYAGTFATNAITLDPQSLNMKGESLTADVNGARNGLKLVYVDATQGWVTVTSTTSELISRQVAATGGTVTTYAGYKVHTFLTSSNFIVSAGGQVDIMMVGGGGGGGGSGGGGGAGGMIVQAGRNLTAATYAIVIGAGGGVSGTTAGDGTAGSNTTFNATDLVAMGGGLGYHSTAAAVGGGSGGGSGYYGTSGGGSEIQTTQSGDSGTYGFGNDGGSGGGYVAPGYSGGGGGGAGGVGGDAAAGANGGNGGAGKDNLYRTGVNITYGGGGGGSTRSGSVGSGGSGGGGAGGSAGTANLGGGGGGGAGPGMTNAYAGGSGIVVIRYTV